MHKCKTGALIKASVLSAAVLCKADQKAMKALEKFADCIGLAFQVKDDILDVEGNSEVMGKNTGSDAAKGKSTFVSIFGPDKSKEMLKELTDQAAGCISGFGEKAWFLKSLTEYLAIRKM